MISPRPWYTVQTEHPYCNFIHSANGKALFGYSFAAGPRYSIDEETADHIIACVNAVGDHDPKEVADALELAHRLKRMPVEWFISRLDMVHELLDARQTQHGLWYVDKGKVVTQTEYYDTALEALRAAQGDL